MLRQVVSSATAIANDLVQNANMDQKYRQHNETDLIGSLSVLRIYLMKLEQKMLESNAENEAMKHDMNEHIENQKKYWNSPAPPLE